MLGGYTIAQQIRHQKQQLLGLLLGKPGLNKLNIIGKVGVPLISLHVGDIQVYNAIWKQPYAEKYALK